MRLDLVAEVYAPLSRAWYGASIAGFLGADPSHIIGELARGSRAAGMAVDPTQSDAWLAQIGILKCQLPGLDGSIFFEFNIPRMGRRVDVVLLIGAVAFVVEFKVGSDSFDRAAIDQVWDYALDLKNFHEASHAVVIVPVLVATEASASPSQCLEFAEDDVARPLRSVPSSLRATMEAVLAAASSGSRDWSGWAQAPYRPTPTIVEAARALYANHSVEAIARHDAGAENLRSTSRRIEELVGEAKRSNRKMICFVTGVPGAGKTLVGLNVATLHRKSEASDHAVYLSGNGPLVAVLREALTRDEAARKKANGERPIRHKVAAPVKAFIQNVHHFRDEALQTVQPPHDHVVVFDEAQRAWNLQKTAQFMKQRKGQANFSQSEAAFLISYLDRHVDWAVIVCLVGGGQEIHTGEAGISAWLEAASRQFPGWELYISDQLADSEYAAGDALSFVRNRPGVHLESNLHLSVSMRSFRAERVSGFVKAALDCDRNQARLLLQQMEGRYPMALTRDLGRAKRWLREHARGTERFGMVASSKAMRLKPHAIDVRVAIDPVHWFLDDPDDTRSSWYLEDCATEFQVQGLELDWICVNWDGDLRYGESGWSYHDFRGKRWQNIQNPDNRNYLRNAYRVLLTRARQGMVIFVPPGDDADATRQPAFYDRTFEYLAGLGVPVLPDGSTPARFGPS